MIDATTLRRLANRLRSAIAVCDEALLPLLERMPEGGWVGKARAVILAFRNELVAVSNELAAADDDPEKTQPRTPSQMMAAVTLDGSTGVSGVRGIAERTRRMLDGGKS